MKDKKNIEMRDSEERDKENKTKDLGSQSKLASRKPCLYSQCRFPQSYFFSTVLAQYQNIWVSPWSMGNLSESYQSYCDHTLSLPPLYSLFSFSLSKRKKTPDHWLYQSTEQWLDQTLLICHRSVQKKKKRLGGSVIRETKLPLRQNTQEFIRVVGQIQ